jgi:uncharacterized protein (DUF885 family)
MPATKSPRKSILGSLIKRCAGSDSADDEENAVLSTVQEISRQVQQEARLSSLLHKSPLAVEPAPVAAAAPGGREAQAGAKKKKRNGKYGKIVDKCEVMIEDELLAAGLIIDRNRAESIKIINARYE